MSYNNLYYEVANPLFQADGVDYRRVVLPSDPYGYLPDDLVVPYGRPIRKLADNEPLTARDVRSALWLAAGNIRKAAERLGVSPARVRAFIRNSPWVQDELREPASAFSTWRRRFYSRRCSPMIQGVATLPRATFSPNLKPGAPGCTR